MIQIGAGIGVGAVLVAALSPLVLGGVPSVTEAALIAAYAAIMLAVCALGCVVPARQALGIQPIEALKSEA